MCVLSLAAANMSIKPVFSKAQFNKCVVFRQTWSQPQTSIHPRSTRGKTTGQGTRTWQPTIILLQLLKASKCDLS